MSSFKSISINNQIYEVKDELARTTKADLDIIAEEYDYTSTYNTGDYVIYNGKLYVCLLDNTSGDWDSGRWSSTLVQKLITDFTSKVETSLSGKVDGAYVEDGVAHFTADGEELFTITGIGGGGSGGGGQNDAVLSVANITGWISTTISESDNCELSFNWSSVENDYPTGDGQIAIRVNGIVKYQQTVRQGEVTVDVREYLGSGQNVVRVTFSDVYGNSKSMSFSISLVSLSISATAFDQSNASSVYDSPVTFSYTPVGAVSKNVVFILDGTIIGTQEVTTSGRQQTFTIPVQNHGSHSFEVYFTAVINGVTVSSNHLFYDLIFVEPEALTPIISSPFNAIGVTQYYTISIPYRVYTPLEATSEVSFQATLVDEDDETTVTDLGTRTVGTSQQTFTYTPSKVGTLTLTITSGSASKSFTLSVARMDIDVEAETDSLELYLSAEGRSNAEARPNTWSFNDISATFTDFTFVSDGWQLDEDNSTYLKVSGNARLYIPFNIFESDFKSTGKTIEFDFSTTDVMDYDTQIVSCYANNKGLIITPQSVSLQAESTSIMTQYKEDEHVRISFVIEKSSENRLIYTYINGILSGIVQYPAGEDFQQTNPVGISIGSNDCIINLYTIRIYSNSLTRHQILDNWIADTPDGATMLARYNHNNVYDEYGDIVINKLPSNLPYLIIESATLPQYKGDKKTISGQYVNPIDPTKSFTFTNASMDVQGTSSAGYPRKNYKIKYKNFVNEDGETSNVYYMRGATESLPTNVFCYKADYASSEGANNVELVRLYNDACPYETEPQQDNSLVRQGIDGIPIVIFWSNTSEGTTSFLGKYNFNYDKGSAVFGFANGDESWETKDNSNDWALFKRADYNDDNWESAYEARYPDDYNDPANLSQVAAWICSTDPEQATNETLSEPVTYGSDTYGSDSAEYRLAKFKNEIEDWFDLEDVLFYYLFTELFLMVDSRVKNSFPTLYASHDGAKWCWLPYDMDTAIGINNEGALAFDYSLEDTDMLSETAGVYNGYQTVMWNNVRKCFQSELASLYQSVRANGIISYDNIEQRFEDHQNTWNEAIFNEDAYFKYIRPFVEDGENNLYMCLGSKAEQRKWWLYNRFRYIDSKYSAGYATSSTLQMRVYQKSDLTITPYADIYASALFDSNLVKERAPRGQATILHSPVAWDPGGSDAVLRIHSADQIKSLGDLSGFYVGAVSFAGATKLQSVKLGDSNQSYSNENLTEVTFGTNKLLTSVDLRNCPNLTGIIDVSHCENLATFHAEGTSINGVSFADGGMVENAYLPDTITNLTLKNLSHLTTFDLNDYSNISTLWIENTDIGEVDGLAIVYNYMDSSGRVRLVGFDKTYDVDGDFTKTMRKIMLMRGIDASGNNLPDVYLNGEVTVGVLNRYIYNNLYRYPYLTVNYTTLGAYDFGLFLRNDEDFTIFEDDVITNIREYAFYYSKVITVNAPNVTTIGNYGFASTANLTNVAFPLLTSIGTYAFNSSGVTGFSAPLLTTIPDYCFNGCNGLSTIGITYANITSIGTYGFASTSAFVEDVAFPALTTLGTYAFSGSGINSFSALSLTTISERAFNNCSDLESVNIPNVTSIGGGYAFNGCSKLTSLFIPKATIVANGLRQCTGVQYLVFNNFYLGTGSAYCNACTSLKVADMRAKADSRWENAFKSCENFDTLIIRKNNGVYTLNFLNAFDGTPFANGGTGGTIYVPNALIESYKTATNWSTLYGYGTVTFAAIEGSQYEHYYADGTPIE